MEKLSVTIYSQESQLRRPWKMICAMFADLWLGRELALQLAIRDIRAQYRQAALGLLWAFILPLAHTLTWIFLSGSGIVKISNTGLPYPVYVFTGTMLWAIFMDAINAPLQQTISAKPMLAKINFPREALVVSGVLQTLFNSVIKIVLLVSVLMFMGIYPGWHLLLLPLGILSLILAGTALGLLITPVGVLYTDIGKSLPLLMQFLMYLTPVVFPMPKGGLAAIIFNLNPLTPLIVNSRNWLTGSSAEFTSYFFMVNGFVLFLLVAVWVVYRAAMPILIERMSA
ncbi:MAG: ABC transporter permease [Proteobacteria bacterium]|nr:ABC transporter permease [Pseudomonadota bacterium]MBU4470434.1 ABC transporter permease [Pseudomonadota bacterium]MCG2753487.1 ABC transporter permease [Desulfobacteraceae bacterium]